MGRLLHEVRSTSPHEVTRLLQAWGSGDERALNQLMPIVYDELHRLARRYMAHEQPGRTLQTTALVHEVYLRLVDVKNVSWKDRAHFWGLCARLMRRILIDFARSRRFQKRGGGTTRVRPDEAFGIPSVVGAELLVLEDALRQLALLDLRKSQVVELRFFGGLTVEETALVLQVSTETVKRDWRLAKAWLTRELKQERPDGA
jgi:RNA polymerase sigma factor (TIGR02999 family)